MCHNESFIIVRLLRMEKDIAALALKVYGWITNALNYGIWLSLLAVLNGYEDIALVLFVPVTIIIGIFAIGHLFMSRNPDENEDPDLHAVTKELEEISPGATKKMAVESLVYRDLPYMVLLYLLYPAVPLWLCILLVAHVTHEWWISVWEILKMKKSDE